MSQSWAEIERASTMQGKFNSRVIDGTLVQKLLFIFPQPWILCFVQDLSNQD